MRDTAARGRQNLLNALKQSNPPRYCFWGNWSHRSSWNSRNSRFRMGSLLIYYKSRKQLEGEMEGEV